MHFKWICLTIATVIGGFLCWAANDLRLEVRRTTDSVNENLPRLLTEVEKTTTTVNDRLPAILANGKESTETLAALSRDIRELRELFGLKDGGKSTGLLPFANEIIRTVEESGGEVGLRPLIGSQLTEVRSAAEWATQARREAMVLLWRANSKKELLDRITRNFYGFEWVMRQGGETASLKDWLLRKHPEWKELKEKPATK